MSNEGEDRVYELVRDKALDTWRVPGEEGNVMSVHQDPHMYMELLREKIVIEARELAEASKRNSRTSVRGECADVLSLLYAFCKAHGISFEEVHNHEISKSRLSGGFLFGTAWYRPANYRSEG